MSLKFYSPRKKAAHPEEWRSVQGFCGYYEVSSYGQIKALKRTIPHERYGTVIRNERIIKTSLDKYGYPQVTLNKLGKGKSMRVHRIVALAFIGPPPPGKEQINHIDCDKLNPIPSNLEWCSAKENIDHAIANDLRWTPRGSACKQSKLREIDILSIRAAASLGHNHKELASRYGISSKYIWEIATYKTWKHVA